MGPPSTSAELKVRRAARANELATRYPEARQFLELYARVLTFQGSFDELCAMLRKHAPPPLAEAARNMTGSGARELAARYIALDLLPPLEAFFARLVILEEPPILSGEPTSQGRCPYCNHPPLGACLRAEGDGFAFHLVCGSCLTEWRFPRANCPGCGESNENKISHYGSDDMPQVGIRVCDSCQRYMHVIHIGKDPAAIPDVDEMAALALDVWAVEQGYRKVHPNLMGV